jgi:hypothetical protein
VKWDTCHVDKMFQHHLNDLFLFLSDITAVKTK